MRTAICLALLAACVAAQTTERNTWDNPTTKCEIFDKVSHFTAGFGDLFMGKVGACICSQMLIMVDLACNSGEYYVTQQCRDLMPPGDRGGSRCSTTLPPTTATASANGTATTPSASSPAGRHRWHKKHPVPVPKKHRHRHHPQE